MSITLPRSHARYGAIIERVARKVAQELAVARSSREYEIITDKAAILSLAFPEEDKLLDLVRRSVPVFLKAHGDEDQL
jgi:hypothetical protein